MSGLVVKPRARIYHGHEWVYSSEVQKVFGDPQPGDVVSLKDFRDRRIGTAIYNPDSQIVARRFSRRKQDLDLDFFRRRFERALDWRVSSLKLGTLPALYRLAWSESDGLPGVIVDRYGDHFVLQTLTLAMDQRKNLITQALVDLFSPAGILERNDSPIRAAENLELDVNGVLYGAAPDPFPVDINGLKMEVDLMGGQKTGLYLDQLDNYAAVGELAKGKRVLDCFCNQGGFALHCARAGAAEVTAVDISEPAIETASRNAELNGLAVNFTAANAFDFLKRLDGEKAQFDLIILDPPSFTRNRKAVKDALRGYKEIHLRALRLLSDHGTLATYSCSHHIGHDLFMEMICDAAVDARRTLRLLDRHSQRKDHPILPSLPESEYLKGYLLQTLPGW